MTKQTNDFSPLKFQEKADGIPVIIDVKQADGSVNTINLFMATNDESLNEMSERAKKVNEETKRIAKKYPAVNEKLDEIDDEDFEKNQQIINGIAEMLTFNYDAMFGEGTYKKLQDAGLGSRTLLLRLDAISEAISDRLNVENEEAKKLSDKKKAERLIKNKKKNGNKK